MQPSVGNVTGSILIRPRKTIGRGANRIVPTRTIVHARTIVHQWHHEFVLGVYLGKVA